MKPQSDQVQVFLRISEHLTGFNEMELLGTGMLESYFNVMMNQNPVDVVEAFLAESDDILQSSKGDPPAIHAAILNNLMPDPFYNGLAKNIITMWYMGNWINEMVSPTAYTQGLIWNVMDSHPPGAKQPGYGSWHRPPLSKMAGL